MPKYVTKDVTGLYHILKINTESISQQGQY